MGKNIKDDIRLIERMLAVYCRDKHGGPGLCPACAALLIYAVDRLLHCPRDPKPACKACPVHCYAPEQRARIKEVMRYSGPRMLLRHPLLTLKHCFGK